MQSIPPAQVEQALRAPSMKRGLLIAIALSLCFMLATGYQSAATLMWRVASTDVMRAASGNAWSGSLAGDVAWFAAAQVILHVVFAIVTWLIALATATISRAARAHFGRTLVLWFCALAAAVIAYNAFWFPRTGLGAYYHDALARTLGPIAVGKVVYLGVFCAALLTLGIALLRQSQRSWATVRGRTWSIGGVLIAAGVASMLLSTDRQATGATTTAGKPHVIVLGIDSLRLGELKRFGGTGVTPNIDRFLASADIIKDTTTPAARTFSSWVAILTGRSPTVTGARFNLADRRTVSANPTVADVLRGQGYHTVYSTDEVRFANIDESYGFDQVVTPPIGASDFLLGTYNELPLASVVINSRLGQLLFPFSYGNRGVATMFQPETYVARLERELSFDRPTLLMAHLTASHWPYYISDTPFGAAEKKHEDDRPMYRIGLQTADQMFGQIVAVLERKGVLKNALVVVLSDHGEALALPGDSMFKDGAIVEGLRAPLRMMDAGHGQSVLSPVQYQVLLGFRSFGIGAGFEASGRDLTGGATVEDIAPTILDLVGVSGDPLHATGESLATTLRASDSARRVASEDRVRFTETDLKVLPATDGDVDEVATARNNSIFFEVDANTGRLHIRQRYAPLALAFKERAAFDEKLHLAAIPAGPSAHQYLLIDKTTGSGRLILDRPGTEQPGAQRLWDEMWKHYAGELKKPVAVTREDWPAIDEAWANFPLEPSSVISMVEHGGD